MSDQAFDANSRQLMRRHTYEAKSGLNFAPDSHYDSVKRELVLGPHTIAIAKTLKRWAAMWAADMREAAAAGIEIDGKAAWCECMRQAEAEIGRYMANNHLTRAA